MPHLFIGLHKVVFSIKPCLFACSSLAFKDLFCSQPPPPPESYLPTEWESRKWIGGGGSTPLPSLPLPIPQAAPILAQKFPLAPKLLFMPCPPPTHLSGEEVDSLPGLHLCAGGRSPQGPHQLAHHVAKLSPTAVRNADFFTNFFFQQRICKSLARMTKYKINAFLSPRENCVKAFWCKVLQHHLQTSEIFTFIAI